MNLYLTSPLVIALALAATGCEKAADHKTGAKKTVTYQAQGPDGRIYTLQGPEGLPREKVLAEIRRRALLVTDQNIPTGCGDDCAPAPQDDNRTPYRGDVQLNYGTTRYGDPTYRYRGEIEDDGYVRLRNLNGDTLRGYVESDGSVRLRNFDGETYRGQIENDGSMKLRDYDGSTLSGQVDEGF